MANLRSNAAKRAKARGATKSQQKQILSKQKVTPVAPSVIAGNRSVLATPTQSAALKGQPAGPGVGTSDTSQLRINPRRADEQIQQQSATRAQSLLGRQGEIKTFIGADGRDTRDFTSFGQPVAGTGTLETQQVTGVQSPTRGLTEAAKLPQFESLEQAQQARTDEFTRTGTVSPETEAAIFRMENPDQAFQDEAGRGATEVRADLQEIADSPSTDPAVKKLVEEGQKLNAQSIDERLENAIGNNTNLFNILSRMGITTASGLGVFSTDGQSTKVLVTNAETIKALEEAGFGGTPGPDGGGTQFVFGSKAELDKVLRDGRSILQGDDIRESERALSEKLTQQREKIIASERQASEQQAADVERSEKLEALRQKTETTSNQITQSLASSKADLQTTENLLKQDPALYQATVSELAGIQASQNTLEQGLAAYQASLPTDAELEDPLLDIPAIRAREQVEKDLLKQSKLIQEENARISRDSQSAQKELLEMRNRQQERRQMENNVEAEKALRTRMNRMGIQTDTGALDFLSTKMRQMDEDLSQLENANDTQELLMNIQIERQFHNDFKSITNQYDIGRLEISKSYEDTIAAIRSGVTQSKAEKNKDYALQSLTVAKELAKLDKDTGTALSTAITSLSEKNAEKVERQDGLREQARSELVDVFEKFPTGSPFRDAAINRAKKLGVDVGGITSADYSLKQLQDQDDIDGIGKFDPFQFKDSEKFDAMATLPNVADKLGGEDSKDIYRNLIRGMLLRGETEKAWQALRKTTEANLNGGIQQDFADKKSIIEGTSGLLEDLNFIQNKDPAAEKQLRKYLDKTLKPMDEFLGGKDIRTLSKDDFDKWSVLKQNARNFVAKEKDPRLQRVYAQVENIAGVIISERYGAAVSGGEMKRARGYIAMSDNTLSDMIIKLEEYSKASERGNRNLLDTAMGRFSSNLEEGAIDDLIEEGPDDDFFNNQFSAPSGNSGGGPRATEDSYGIFQINMDPAFGEKRRKTFGIDSNEALLDPSTNAAAAFTISGGGQNWNPWTTWTSGKYQPYMGFRTLGKMDDATAEQHKQLLKNAGFKGKKLEQAFAITMAESGGRSDARNSPQTRGQLPTI